MVSNISKEKNAPFRGQKILEKYENIAFFRNSGSNFPIATALHPRRFESSETMLWEPETSYKSRMLI
jgi:hypothetical protein